MNVRHGTSVIVTDGRKAMLLRNEGDAEFPNLRLVKKWEQELAADRDIKTDAPGHSFSSSARGSRRSAFEETDLHDAAEADFVSAVARELATKCAPGAIEQLIVVAPPRALGEFRKHSPEPLKEAIVAELAKDLVKHPVADIEEILLQR